MSGWAFWSPCSVGRGGLYLVAGSVLFISFSFRPPECAQGEPCFRNRTTRLPFAKTRPFAHDHDRLAFFKVDSHALDALDPRQFFSIPQAQNGQARPSTRSRYTGRSALAANGRTSKSIKRITPLRRMLMASPPLSMLRNKAKATTWSRLQINSFIVGNEATAQRIKRSSFDTYA